jgi:hypoxanthine-DNA glycosylase
MPRVTSFPPTIGTAPRALVLGSMPGVASLRAQQYYAHPRNAFWPLMDALFGVPAAAPYAARIAALHAHGVGLWDALAECERPGSLDAAIAPASIRVNPVAALLDAHPSLVVIALNGSTAARLFDRHLAPALRGAGFARADRLAVLRLPSTSPAHAARSFEQKRMAWAALADAMRAPAAAPACA